MQVQQTSPDLHQIAFQAINVFTPGSPLNERELFSGRLEQVQQVIEAIIQTGFHVVLYGDRGIGKTSLSNVLVEFLKDVGQDTFVIRVNCNVSDNYRSLWTKALRKVNLTVVRESVGFTGDPVETTANALDLLSKQVTPDDVCHALETLSADMKLVIIFDEFDRLKDKLSITLMADTIKALSDHAVDATMFLIGVADSVEALIGEHLSIERTLVQVRLPRMSQAELQQILNRGLSKLNLKACYNCLAEIASLSQGLPYVTHLLGLHTVRAACNRRAVELTLDDVERAVHTSIAQWGHSIGATFLKATHSHQPEHLYRQVLAACALAIPDEMGYFTAASVRHPLCVITGRPHEISNFNRHLAQFTKAERGAVLQQTGTSRKLRYRFESPLMKAYIIIRGFADGRLSRRMIEEIEARRVKAE